MATGGEDGIVQLIDLKMMKLINQFEIDSPVLSLDMNSSSLAVGSMDRMARIYEINPGFSQVGSTKS